MSSLFNIQGTTENNLRFLIFYFQPAKERFVASPSLKLKVRLIRFVEWELEGQTTGFRVPLN